MSKTLGQRLADLNIEFGTAMTIDWEQVRIQAAIAAMQSYISDGERMALVSKKFDYDDKIISKFIAEGAVMYADALIDELKKGGEDDSNMHNN